MNVGDLAKLIVAKGFKSCPKSNKSPNLVTLVGRPVPNENNKNKFRSSIGIKPGAANYLTN